MLAIIATITPIICLTAVAITIEVFGYLEERLRKKAEVLEYMMDKDYETDKVDINKL